MSSIENSLKHEAEVGPGKIRLSTSGEFVRAYNHSAWLFYCCISKYKVIRKYSKARQENLYFLGFPVSKLLELANGRICEKTDFGYDITLQARVNSMLGVLSHYDCYQMRKVLVNQGRLCELGEVAGDCLRFYPDTLRLRKFQTRRGSR